MAYGLPDNLWIGLLVMAVIILALLWKDKISKSSGGGGKTKTTPDGPEFNSIEHKPVNPDPGQEVNFKADYSANASINKYWFKVDGKKRDTTITGGSLKTGPLTFEEGSYSYKAYLKDENGKDSSIGSSFSVNSGRTLEGPKLKVKEEWGDEKVVLVAKAESRSADNISLTEIAVEGVGQSENRGPEARIEIPVNPGQTYSYNAETVDSNDLTAEVEGEITIPRNPSSLAVTANYEIINEIEGNVRIWAEVTEYSNEIEKVRVQYRPEGAGEDAWVTKDTENDIRAEINQEDLSKGIYEVRAIARDSEENRATDTITFSLGDSEGRDGPVGDYPELVRIINQNSSNSIGDLGGFRGDQEVMALLEQILEEVDGSGGDIRGPGMDAYQLLFALNSLGVDLDGGDNQQIVDELRRIRQQMGSGGMSPNELENALKNVLHDVFGQDLQSLIQGLDIGDGFDEDAIVRAIENKDIDFSEVTDRLDRLEQTVSQIRGQGGNVNDVEQKLDDIESAITELKADDQIYQGLMAEIEALRSEGVKINLDMNDPLIIKLVEDIQNSSNPQAERTRILQAVRREGVLTRRTIMMLLDRDDKSGGKGNKNRRLTFSGMGWKQEVGGELNHLHQLEGMLDKMEKFEDREIVELKRIKKLTVATEKALNTAYRHSPENIAGGMNQNWEEVVKDYAIADELLNRLRRNIKQFEYDEQEMEELVEHFDKAESKLTEKMDDFDKNVVETLRGDDISLNFDVESKMQHYQKTDTESLVQEATGDRSLSLPDLPGDKGPANV